MLHKGRQRTTSAHKRRVVTLSLRVVLVMHDTTCMCVGATCPIHVCMYIFMCTYIHIRQICIYICTYEIGFVVRVSVCSLHISPHHTILRMHAAHMNTHLHAYCPILPIPHQACSQRKGTLAVALSPPPARRCALTHNVAVAGSTARRDAKTDVSKPHAGVLLEKL